MKYAEVETHCAAAEEGACDHCDERDLCAAGDKGGGHDRHTAVTLIFDGTGSHDTGNAAADADEHRDEGLTGKAELAEDTVKNEGDTSHVAAGFEESQHQEQNEHLGDKAKDRADTGDDTVKNKSAEPIGCVCSFKAVSDEHGDAGHPHAVVGGIGSVKAVLLEVINSINIGHGDSGFFIRAVGDGVIVSGHVVDREGFFILNADDSFLGLGLERFCLSEESVAVEVVCFNVGLSAEERIYSGESRGVLVVDVIVLAGADAEQVPAVAEHAVICPVGSGSADSDHCDPVNEEHNNRKYRQAEPTVSDNLIDLIGSGEAALVFLLVAALDNACYVDVALVGDDALCVVIQLLLGGLDVLLDVSHNVGGDAELLKHLVITLEDLYCVPALLLLGHVVNCGFLDVSYSMLNNTGEGVHRNGLGVLGGLYCSLGCGP